jgi:two-component system, NarL family, response regulator DevR
MTTDNPPVRILLVDDSTLVREGIRSVLGDAQPPIHVVGEAGTVADALVQAEQCQPDVVLLDIRLPDGTGFAACREMLKRQPALRVLVLTSFTNDSFIYEAITSGAQGYLMKEIDPHGLVQAIHDLMAGKSILSPDITAGVMRMVRGGGSRGETGDLSILSAQERRVLALVAEGKTNKQIAEALGLSDNTVKNYLCNVFEKLHVRRRSQAAALYVQAHPPVPPS